jgi:hypothetical protein
MASSLAPRPFDLSEPKSVGRFLKRLTAASRIDDAERELRRHGALLPETALVQGEFRRISLVRAAVLPFTA